jgi:hypothetical protein
MMLFSAFHTLVERRTSATRNIIRPYAMCSMKYPRKGVARVRKAVSSEPYQRLIEAYVSTTGCDTYSSMPLTSSSSPPYAGSRWLPFPVVAHGRHPMLEGWMVVWSTTTGAAGDLQRRGQCAAVAAVSGISERGAAACCRRGTGGCLTRAFFAAGRR